eukprot:3424971-Prymnesium_polylepis.2
MERGGMCDRLHISAAVQLKTGVCQVERQVEDLGPSSASQMDREIGRGAGRGRPGPAGQARRGSLDVLHVDQEQDPTR